MNASMAARAIPEDDDAWRRLWLRTAVRGAALLVAYFVAWEVVEQALLSRGSDLHAWHLVRGSGAALMLASWAFLQVRDARRSVEDALEAQLRVLEARVAERTREVEASRQFTELVLDSLRERIVVLDGQGRILKANRVATEVAGRAILGDVCADVFATCPCTCGCGAVTAAPGAVVDERADGQGRIWELEAIGLPEGTDQGARVVGIGRDVTTRVSLEAQVRHQEKMASLGLLAAGFAHDLGSPLASITTELELLEGDEDVERMRASLGVLRRHVRRIQTTLRELVDFARRRREEVTDVALASVVDDSVRLVCHDPRWRDVRVTVDVEPDLPCVRMVEDRLVLVLVNLLLNAADAMPDGGPLRISAKAEGAEVVVDVVDSGTGMTEEALSMAGTPLFTTKGGRGTGLGLAVSKRVLESVGGRLCFERAEGPGTVVRVRLPAATEAT